MTNEEMGYYINRPSSQGQYVSGRFSVRTGKMIDQKPPISDRDRFLAETNRRWREQLQLSVDR